MNDTLNICLACGICCDGTLIGHVQLEPQELASVKNFKEIEEEDGKGFFLQPCKNYCDGCNIYSNRPKQCAKFECGLLKSVEQKSLDFDMAVEIVNIVKQKKNDIEQKIDSLQIELLSPSFYFKMMELKNILLKKEIEADLTPRHLELIQELEQLNDLIDQNFDVTLY